MTDALKRRIGLPLLTAYGVGVMVGAGIYVLVGAVAEQAGTWAWLAFGLAGLIALPSALSFAELASRVPEAGGAAAYMRAAFRSDTLGVFVGLAMVLAGTISAAAVLRGGVGYLTGIVPISTELGIMALGLGLTAIAIWGVVESLSFAAILTLIEVVGLVLVIVAGLSAIPAQVEPAVLDQSNIMLGLSGVLAAVVLAFFAFIGFEDIVNLAEETRDPQRTVPRAIIAALIVVSAIYALVAFSATRAVPPQTLAGSDRPLVLVWQAWSDTPAVFLSAIAVAAALNGVLAQIVMAARVLFGLGRHTAVFSVFHAAHPRLGTPVLASLAVGAGVIICALALPVATLAQFSATTLLVVFVLVNAALLRMKSQGAKEAPFQVATAVPALGLLASLGALIASIGDLV